MSFEVARMEIAKLELAAGDVLVVKIDDLISTDTRRRIEQAFSPAVPAGVKIAVLDSKMSLSVVTRAEIAAMPAGGQ